MSAPAPQKFEVITAVWASDYRDKLTDLAKTNRVGIISTIMNGQQIMATLTLYPLSHAS